MGKSSGGGKQTTTTEPPKYLQPYLQGAVSDARSIYGQGGPSYYPGNTVVPFSPQTERALGLTEQRALNGSPVTQAAQNYTTSTLSSPVTSRFGTSSYDAGPNMFGSGSNPWLDQTFDRAADAVQQRLQSGFAGAGRNIEAGAPVAKEQFSDLAASIYGGDYQNERNRQLQYQQQLTGINAAGYENERNRMLQDLTSQGQQRTALSALAPELAAQDYRDYAALSGVGQQVEDLTGRLIADQAARWDYEQNRAGLNLDRYLGHLGQYPGQTQTTPVYRNGLAGALGGGTLGYSIGSGIGAAGGAAGGAAAGGAAGGAATGSMAGPWGALIGAGLGYLLS